jgi:ketose-bisphosphate aldolase
MNSSQALRKIIRNCLENNKAILAFNVQNTMQLDALCLASMTLNKPVIAQFSSKYIPYFDQNHGMPALVSRYQRDLVFFHLDHCNDDSLIKYCIDIGFASVMYDGSRELLDTNIYFSNKYYQYGNGRSLIEVELGSIGGQEDGFGGDHLSYFKGPDLLRFKNEANFDLLALGIGNVHGVYNSLSVVRIELLELSNELVGRTPLVLHGATGMSDEMIFESINYGVVKINFSTNLKFKTLELIKDYTNSAVKYEEMEFASFVSKELNNFFIQLIDKFS